MSKAELAQAVVDGLSCGEVWMDRGEPVCTLHGFLWEADVPVCNHWEEREAVVAALELARLTLEEKA